MGYSDVADVDARGSSVPDGMEKEDMNGRMFSI
jgi:hypothetical protein